MIDERSKKENAIVLLHKRSMCFLFWLHGRSRSPLGVILGRPGRSGKTFFGRPLRCAAAPGRLCPQLGAALDALGVFRIGPGSNFCSILVFQVPPGTDFSSISSLILHARVMPLALDFWLTFVNSELVFAGLGIPCGDFIRDICKNYLLVVLCVTPKILCVDFILSTSGRTAPDVAGLGCIPGKG